MREMTAGEMRAFLLEGTRTAALATVRADGRPHVAPVWFTLDADDVIFTTWHDSVKGKNLRRSGQVAVMVDDAAPPYAFVTIEGEADISEDLSALRYWAMRIAARYMGSAMAETYGARNGVPGELLIRVRPMTRIGKWGVAE